MRPIVRILLRNGVPSDALTQIVRKTYVDVAAEEFGLEGKRQTLSRISVITGLNRKEVSRLIEIDPADLGARAAARHRAASVLTAWLRAPDFLDHKGDPIDLPFAGKHSFSELVRRFSRDMKPRAMADELFASGAIEMVGTKIRLTARGFVPAADVDDLLAMLGADTAQFIETIDHNLRNADKLLSAQGGVPQRAVALRGRVQIDVGQVRRNTCSRNSTAGSAARSAEPESKAEPTVTLGLGIFQIEQPETRNSETRDEDPRDER